MIKKEQVAVSLLSVVAATGFNYAVLLVGLRSVFRYFRVFSPLVFVLVPQAVKLIK